MCANLRKRAIIKSATALQEALSEVEKINKEAKEIAEASSEAAMEALRKAEEIRNETKEIAEAAAKAFKDAISRVEATQTTDNIDEILPSVLREAINSAKAREAKERWLQG